MTSVNDDKKNESSTFSAKVKKTRHKTTFRKAPQAPKRFKSSYILFFCAKRGGIKNELGSSASVSRLQLIRTFHISITRMEYEALKESN